MPISFRASRNLGVGILLAILIGISIYSYGAMHQTVQGLKHIITQEKVKFSRYTEVTELVIDAQQHLDEYIDGRRQDVSLTIFSLDDAFKRLEIIQRFHPDSDEKRILKQLSTQIQRLKISVFNYVKERKEGYQGGASNQESEQVLMDLSEDTTQLVRAASQYINERIQDKNNQILKIAILSRRVLLIGLVLGIIFAFFTLVLMSHALSYPIEQLVAGTAEIAKGNLDYKLKLTSNHEFTQIASAFNQMTQDLRYSREDILRSKELLTRVTEGIEEGIMLLDTEFRILWANKKISELGHLDPENMVGNFCYKVTHRRDTPCEAPHDICPMVEVLKTEKPASVIHTHFDEKGNKFYAEVTVYPVRDKEGRIKQFIHIARDITELKRYAENLEKANVELKETHAKLIQSAKMAAVGQLAGGVAHEINNPLTGILNNVQLIKLEAEERKGCALSDFKEALDSVEEAALRCKHIIRSLLDFSRASKSVYWPVAVNEIIEKTLLLAEAETKLENIRVIRGLSENLPLVMADSNQLQQAFLDIINNAVWALKEKRGGDLKIKTEAGSDDKSVSIIFSDTGCGIAPENLPHIFEPFFTTKKTQEGTGLGLSICYGIIKEHNGKIEASSEGKDKGAAFKITLPAIDALPKPL